VQDGEVVTNVANPEDKKERALWGAYSAHVANMVEGVASGFKKELEISGVGYRASMQGKDLKLEVGFSHPIVFKIPSSVLASIDKNFIKLESADIELLGRIAAEVRNVKKPEPYKGKGIKYIDETIRRKAGKTATKAAA
jgi:large subunit ribosomal protein L6